MKPAPFEYAAPESLATALSLLQDHGPEAKLLAGGQSLIPLLNFRLARPAVLIDLNRIAELDYIHECEGGGIRIGAMARQRSLERHPLIAARAPLLHEAIPFIAHPQIRNRGTIGGSLAHADPASELPVAALALDARFRLQSASGERWVAARDFFVGLLATALEPDEMLVEIEFPPPLPASGWSFMEIARRHGDYAQAGVAVLLQTDGDGGCRLARLVYLSAGDGPTEAPAAAAQLVAEGLADSTLDAAARLAAETEIAPSDDIHSSAQFKRHLCRVLTRRALGRAVERAAAGAGG